MIKAICISCTDDVANVLSEAAPGALIQYELDRQPVVAQTVVPKHHKIALRNLVEGHQVVRGGLIIGVASQNIAAGAHVHTHNLKSLRGNVAKGESRDCAS